MEKTHLIRYVVIVMVALIPYIASAGWAGCEGNSLWVNVSGGLKNIQAGTPIIFSINNFNDESKGYVQIFHATNVNRCELEVDGNLIGPMSIRTKDPVCGDIYGFDYAFPDSYIDTSHTARAICYGESELNNYNFWSIIPLSNSSASFTVKANLGKDTEPPNMGKIEISPGIALINTPIRFSVSAMDNVDVTGCAFQFDGNELAAMTEVESGAFYFTYAHAANVTSSHAVAARCFDASGNSKTGPTTALTIYASAPPTAEPPQSSQVACQSGYKLDADGSSCILENQEIKAIASAEPTVQPEEDRALANRLRGYVLLQVQDYGKAWYVHDDGSRFYMRDGSAAYSMMRSFGLGITDSDLNKIPVTVDSESMRSSASVCSSNQLANRLKGKILLQTQQHGEAWYIHPDKCRRIYLKDGEAAYSVMRYLSLGISDSDISKIPTGELK